MKWTLVAMVLAAGMVVAGGCGQDKATHKQEALQRWQSARGGMTVQMAREQLERGELKQAESSVMSVLRHDERYAPGHVVLGRVRLEQGELRGAQASFERALELEPGSGEAAYGLGVLAERRGRLAEAYKWYEQAWQSKPHSASYLLAMVEAQVGLGEVEAALARLLEAMEETEPTGGLYMTAGRLLARQGQVERAVGMYREARMLAPESPLVAEALGLALAETGRHAQALVLFEELSAKSGAESESHWFYELSKADCYAALGDFQEAQRSYTKVCEARPTDARPWARRARVALQAKRADQAEAYAQRALALDGSNREAKLVLGYMALQVRDYAKAEEFFRGLMTQSAEGAMAYCLLGQSLEAQGRHGEARQCYAKALELDPDERLAAELLDGLGETQVGQAEPAGTF